ncbi:MAG: hypothetical protein M1358_04110 [Chloroflexi bacterium]|nr:hypothetical protein [Chloroflexota bacterium]
MRDLTTYSGVPFDEQALVRVAFWIGVGERDNVAEDVPREWDGYIGQTRLERAQAFASALEAMGASVEFQVFPGQGHEETRTSLDRAMTFLQAAAQTARGGNQRYLPRRLLLLEEGILGRC